MSAKSDQRRRKRRAQAQAITARRRTPGQDRARAELFEVATAHPLVLDVQDLHIGKGDFRARLRIDTSGIARVPSGLPLDPHHENIELWFGDTYPNRPPAVLVGHARFAGHPHVLVGCILCIYLDHDREWHPALGVPGVVERLIEWLRDAAADRFDRRAALFHPIGGLPPSPMISGTLVVRMSATTRKPIGLASLHQRTPQRTDLLHWARTTTDDPPGSIDALVLHAGTMPHGLIRVDTLGDLLARVQHAGGPQAQDALDATARLVRRIGDNPLRIVVEIDHPTDPTLSYIAAAVARALVPPPYAHRSDIVDHLPLLPIGWTAVSDERSDIATRRDSRRPTTAYAGKTIEIWGCGGLGSWIAEFVARAGAERIILRDSGTIARGLLVRQNYREDDVGHRKVEQLAERLQAVVDDLTVEAHPGDVLTLLADGYTTTADVLVDATINVTVAARLDEWKRDNDQTPLLAQVATDPRTATLGLLIVATPHAEVGPATIDDATWEAIRNDPAAERFHGFWTPPTKADQIVPALGCSTPTFHGSAADLASIAGSLVTLLASHLGTTTSGTHLIEASHAHGRSSGGHRFVPHEPT